MNAYHRVARRQRFARIVHWLARRRDAMPETLHPPPDTRCLCFCHAGSIGDRYRSDGVSLYDVVEAAVACRYCRGRHAVALLSSALANAPDTRVYDPYGWADPPRKPEGEDGG